MNKFDIKHGPGPKAQSTTNSRVTESESRLDQDLLRFLEMRVPTVEHLEVLLLVSSRPEYWWTVRALNDLQRSREDSIRSRLKELCEERLLMKKPNEESYRLKDDPDLSELMQRLRSAYKVFRVRVIEVIYGTRPSARDRRGMNDLQAP